MSSSEERSVHCTQVVLYEVERVSGKCWTPQAGGQWAEYHIFHTPLPPTPGIYRMVAWIPDTEEVVLNAYMAGDTDWALTGPDFAEFENPGEPRKGMYFASEAQANETDAVIFAAVAKLTGGGMSRADVFGGASVGSPEAPKRPHGPTSPTGAGPGWSPASPASPDAVVPTGVVLTPDSSPHPNRRSTAPPERPLTMSLNGSRRVSLALFEHVSAAIAEAAATGDMGGAVGKERERLASRDLSSLGRSAAVSEDGSDTSSLALSGSGRGAAAMAPSLRSRSGSSSPMRTPSVRLGPPSEPPPPAPEPLQTLAKGPLHGPAALVQLSSLTPLQNRGAPVPENLQHQVHVIYNSELARYEGLPEAWSQLNVQFGVPFQALPKVDCGLDKKIPAVVAMLRRELLAGGGPDVEGIFRLAPDKALCLEVKERINSGTFEQGAVTDMNILANLIKVWFRELPVCLFDPLPDETILRVAALPQRAVAAAMETFPEPVKSLTFWLCDTMADVVVKEDVNRMTARNMAIVMSPNLFSVSADNPMFALTMSQKIADFTEKCLKAWLVTRRGYGQYE